MLTPDEMQAIRAAPWLGGAAYELAQLLLGMADVRRVKAGQTVVHQSSAGDYCLGVAGGLVKLTSVAPCGRELFLEVASPGDWFGAMPLMDEAPHAYEASACVPATLLAIKKCRLVEAVKNCGPLGLAFARLYAARANAMQEKISHLMLLTLEQRLIVQLLSLSTNYGTQSGDGVRIDLKLSQREIANLVGSSRQRINEAIKRLERLRLIRQDDAGLVLLDRNALAALTSSPG